jgi:ABC-2 type transport system permease protein
MHSVRLFPRLVWFEAQRYRAYPLEAIATVAERLIYAGLFILFWLLVGRYSGAQNIHAKDVIGYYMLMSGLIPFFYTNFSIANDFIVLVKEGRLSQLLIRPVNVLVYPWAQRTGRSVLNYIVSICLIAGGLLVSAPHWTPAEAALFVPVIINMFFINAAFNVLIGTIAFYFVEAKGFQSSCNNLFRLLRGEIIALYYMPPQIAHALQFTPFPASLYHLTALLQGKYPPAPWQVAIGSLWAAGLSLLAILAWRRGLKKYEAVGL